MPFLNKQERETVKRLLDDVMSDADVKDQFNKAQARRAEFQRAGVIPDYTDAMLNQYAGIMKEIIEDRDQRARNVASAAKSPDLETLKKKYLGPKTP